MRISDVVDHREGEPIDLKAVKCLLGRVLEMQEAY